MFNSVMFNSSTFNGAGAALRQILEQYMSQPIILAALLGDDTILRAESPAITAKAGDSTISLEHENASTIML